VINNVCVCQLWLGIGGQSIESLLHVLGSLVYRHPVLRLYMSYSAWHGLNYCYGRNNKCLPVAHATKSSLLRPLNKALTYESYSVL
jgi:hypothetical protein